MDRAAAAERAVARMARVGGAAGCIVLDRNGAPSFAQGTRDFPVAMMSSNMTEQAIIRRENSRQGALPEGS